VTAADAALQVREAAGRRARDEAQMLDRLVESLRLASFRTYLSATIVSMSSLVPDVLAMGDTDVPSALQRLRPGHIWPSITSREHEYGQTGPKSNRMVRVGPGRARRPAMLVGDAIIAEGVLGPWIEARVCGGSFDVVLRVDGFQLSTQDGFGYVRCPAELPSIVIEACAGRPLADVVDHPLLRAHDFVIKDAANLGGGSSFSFDVGRLPVELPWRE
jgi:hypothetical protein